MDAGATADTDADSDSDGDADIDGDTDTDTDTDVTGSCPMFVDGSLDGYTGHDGSTWALAYATVQEGIDAAAAMVETAIVEACAVWVAAGTYLPTEDSAGEADPDDPRTKTVLLKSGVALYGGFGGGELILEERDVSANPTILSGDIGAAGDISDNAYHVVTGSTGAIIDGFTITGGNADFYTESPPTPKNRGGGMYNFESSPTVTGCTFLSNSGGFGGGMYNEYSSPIVTSCTFSDNAAGCGGGMYNRFSSAPSVTDCTFEGNEAGSGGGMENSGSSFPAVASCTFVGNTAPYGGGMYNSYSWPTVTGCTFEENSAVNGFYPNDAHGGGMYNSESSPIVTSCIFVGNTTDNAGGGMQNAFSEPIVTSCTFEGNSAVYGGGMANHYESAPLVTNCLFSGDAGHSMHNNGSEPIVTNCTFLGGAEASYGGVYNNNGATPTLTSCILWGRNGMIAHDTWSSTSSIVTYSVVQGGCTVESECTTDETGNIDADPLFVNDEPDAGEIDLHLQAGSPCIDTGDVTALPADTADLDGDSDTAEPIPFDLDGNTRIVGAGVDMGAYEVE